MAAQRFMVYMLVAIVGLAFLVGLLVGLPQLQITGLETNAQQVSGDASGWKARGNFPGIDGAQDEVLDAGLYVTAHSPNLDSQKVVAAGYIYKAGLIAPSAVTQYRYRVFTSQNAIVWNELNSSPYVFNIPTTFSSELAAQSIIVVLKGPYEGALRVQFELRIEQAFIDRGWFLLVSDQAYLKSGIGSISAPSQVQVGETISISWDIPYVSTEKDGAKGWSLFGYSRAQNRIVLGPVDLGQLRGSVQYTATASDFVTTTDCRNEIEWTLRNELWNRDFKTTTVIDISAFGPSVSITAVEGDRKAGQPITVRWDAQPNPTTKLALARIVVKWGFGGVEHEDNLTAGTREYTFTPAGGGTVHFEVIVYDTGCRPAPTAEVDIHIREPGQVGTGIEPNWLVFALIIAASIAIAALVAVFVPAPPALRGVAFVAIVVVGVLIAVVAVPEVLTQRGA